MNLKINRINVRNFPFSSSGQWNSQCKWFSYRVRSVLVLLIVVLHQHNLNFQQKSLSFVFLRTFVSGLQSLLFNCVLLWSGVVTSMQRFLQCSGVVSFIFFTQGAPWFHDFGSHAQWFTGVHVRDFLWDDFYVRSVWWSLHQVHSWHFFLLCQFPV